MALDINDGYKSIQKKISSTQKYKQVDKDIQDLKKKNGESLEKKELKNSEVMINNYEV